MAKKKYTVEEIDRLIKENNWGTAAVDPPKTETSGEAWTRASKDSTKIPVLNATNASANASNTRSGLNADALQVSSNKQSTVTKKAIETPSAESKSVIVDVDKFLSDDYKMSDAEKSAAKEYAKSYLDEYNKGMRNRTISSDQQIQDMSDPNSEYMKMNRLLNKTKSFSAAGAGLIESILKIPDALGFSDKMSEIEKKLTGTDYSVSEMLGDFTADSETQSKGAYSVGYTLGEIGKNAVTVDALNKVPAFANLKSKATNQLGESALNILGDLSVDTMLETLPNAINDVRAGKEASEVAKNAATNIGVNALFNVLGEGVQVGLGKLFKKASDTKIPELKSEKQLAEEGKQSIIKSAKERVSTFFDNVMSNKGHTTEKYNQLKIGKVPADVAEKVKQASGGTLDISEKEFAIEGSKLYHEMVKHGNEKIELSRGQLPLTKADIEKTVDVMMSPDIVENLSTGLASEQRKTFAMAKLDEGYIVLVEDVGGKRNPTIVPEQILHVGRDKMERYIKDGKSIADMIYENSERKGTLEDNLLDIKNRVTAAQLADGVPNAPAHTSETSQRSPLQNGAYQMENADNMSPLPTSETEVDLTPNSSVPTNTENVKIPYLGDNTNNLKAVDINTPQVTKDVSTEIPYLKENTTSGGKVLEESYSKNIGEGRVNNVDDEVKKAFVDSPNLYTQLSNAETAERAQQIYASGSARSEIYRMLDQKDPASIPLGNKIVGDLIDEGKQDEAVELLRTMSSKLRESGQFTQAAAISMMKSDPETALRYVVRNIDDMNAAGQKKFGKAWKDFVLTDAETNTFRNIKKGDTDAIKSAFEEVGERLAKEYPSTAWEKTVELTRVGMLLNPRTNVRNYISNALLQPVRSLSDRVSALGQNAIHLINPDFKVTQSITGGGKKEKQVATEVWNSMKDSLLENTSRYEDLKGAIKDKQVFKGSAVSKLFDTIFPGAIEKANKAMGKNVDDSLLETARNFTYYLLEKGDEPFVKNNFVNRLASYMKAQGLTSIDEIPEDAIMLAKDEALKATFKDDNNFTKMLSGIKQNLGKAGEVIMPFTKTPANLAMRGIDYSPAGIVSTIKNAKNGADVGKVIDDLSKNITGTAAIALGYYLTKEGIITGALSSDKDEAAFQKQQGQLAYSIKVGDNYYSYDWAQPASIPFILGASIAQSIEETDDEEKTALEKIESIANIGQQAITSAADTWIELSPLQTISDIFDTSSGNSVPENIINELLEFPQRFIPSALGAAARTIDTTQRQTYSAGNPIRTQFDTAVSKIPYLSETLPAAYDTWGREIKRSDTTGEAAFAQMLNPGTLGNSATTPIDGEIQRLYEATENAAVFPQKSKWTVDGNQLSNREYSELQKEQGTLSYEMAETLINSETYQSLDDSVKAETLADVYSLSKALAENSVVGKNISAANQKLANIYNDKGADGLVQYLTLKATADMDGSGSITQEEAQRALDKTGMSNLQKAYYWKLFNSSWVKNPYQ